MPTARLAPYGAYGMTPTEPSMVPVAWCPWNDGTVVPVERENMVPVERENVVPVEVFNRGARSMVPVHPRPQKQSRNLRAPFCGHRLKHCYVHHAVSYLLHCLPEATGPRAYGAVKSAKILRHHCWSLI